MNLSILSMFLIMASVVYNNYGIKTQIALLLGYLIYFIYKKYTMKVLVFIIVVFFSWFIRVNDEELVKDNYYTFKIIKHANLGKVLKVNDQLNNGDIYVNLNYLDIEDGIYDLEANIKNIKLSKNISYLELEIDNFKNHWSNKYRNHIREKIENIGKDNSEVAFLKSVVLGEKSDLNIEIKERFNYLGISHIIVISGLHIAIMLYGILGLFRLCGVSYHLKYILVLVFITSYSTMLGFAPSVQRSYIMALLYILSKLFFEKKDVKKSLHLALSISLVLNPTLVMNIGFQMSYIAVFAIIYFYPVVERSVSNNILKLVLFNFVIQLMLTPIFLYNFGMLYVLAFIANILLVPVAGILINSAFLSIFFSLFNIDILNKTTSGIFHFIYRSLIGISTLFEKIPYMRISIKEGISFFMFCWLYLMFTIIYFKLNKETAK